MGSAPNLDENGVAYGVKHTGNRPNIINYVWDTDLLDYVAMTQPLVKTDNLTVSGSMSVSNFPDPTAKYKITDIDPTDGNSYFGYTDDSGKWYIMNLTAATARYVKGDGGYIAAWAGKAGLSYDYFYNVF